MEQADDSLQDDSSPKESTKTWGFRRSTIARREFMDEIGNLDIVSVAPRRGGRQPRARGRGRGRQAAQGPAPAVKRGRGGRKSAPANLGEGAAALSQPSLLQKSKSDVEASDSDELTLRELQERVRNRQKAAERSQCSESAAGLNPCPANKAEDASSDENAEDSDPSALYCICRQTHNNRFMICCDRCQEWFHGDCVGISEARGLLLEKNGEDYICPSCSPCPSPVNITMQPVLCKAALSSSSEDLFSSSAGEERPSEDEGIKGKIRKASIHCTKKKIMIFQPVEVKAPTPKPKQTEKQEVTERATLEETKAPLVKEAKAKATAPKCIGPGCNNDALPESVYCGHQCIIRHAAVAMQTLSEPKPQPELKAKAAPKPVLKIQNLGKLFKRKSAEKPAEEEAGRSKEKAALVRAAPLSPGPDHKAKGAQQQPAAIAPSLFYKSTEIKEERMCVEIKADKLVTHQTEDRNTSAFLLAIVPKNVVDKTASSEASTAQNAPETKASSEGHSAQQGAKKAALAEDFAAKIAAEKVPPASDLTSLKTASSEVLTPQKAIEKSSSEVFTANEAAKIAVSSKSPGAQKASERASLEGLFAQTGPEEAASPEGPAAQKETEKVTSSERSTAEIVAKIAASSEDPTTQNNADKSASSEGLTAKKDAEIDTLLKDATVQQAAVKTASSEDPAAQIEAEKVASSEGPAAEITDKKATSAEGPTPPKEAEKSPSSEGPAGQKPSKTEALSEHLAAQKEAEKAAPIEGLLTKKFVKKPASSAPPLKSPLTSRAKKTMPGSPRVAAPRQTQNEAPQACKNVSAIPFQTPSPTPEPRVLPVTPAPVPPSRPLQAHPNMQMRQNIRRSLTDTLLKRVNDSEDLEVPESDLEKLAVNIEREMFNMYYTTDSKYKTKYRSLLLSLKDPRNKGLFYQVVRGLITPFKLTHLSQEELLSIQECIASPLIQKEDLFPACLNKDEPFPSCENKVLKSDNVATPSKEKMSVSQVRPAHVKKVGSAVSNIISSMLKDTTAEHKMHLFDVKCRICTGQVSDSEGSETKKLKKEEPKDESEEKPPCALLVPDKKPPPAAITEDSLIIESPASPTSDDCFVKPAQPDFTPPVIPAVSIVTITRRDPRTAAPRSSSASSANVVLESTPTPERPQNLPSTPRNKETVKETKTLEPQPPPLPPPMLKSILMKPLAPSVSRFYSSSNSTTGLTSSHTPADNETSQFLSKQETFWKGFLNMQSVAKFVTKGCIISGSAETLKKDLPDTIHVGGRILPQTVWEYVERVKTSVTKELCLIRFYPASDEEEVAYVSLFSYFNSRRRFGVVSNICNNIKDLYLIPLGSNQCIPSMLLPLEGPGLEQKHPNLLIGLAVCQKLKRHGSEQQELDEKRPKVQMLLDPQVLTFPTKPAGVSVIEEPYDPAIPIISTPPGSPPSMQSPDSSSSSFSSLSGPSVLSNILSVVNPPSSVADISETTGLSGPSSSSTPLQTILQTLFGNRQQSSDLTVKTCEPGSSSVKESLVPAVDPIVQRYQQTIIEKTSFDDNDRPYDPEEEYDPSSGCKNVTPLKPSEISKLNTPNAADEDDRPYDPEEEYNLGNKVDAVSISSSTKCCKPKQSTGAPAVNEIAYDPEDETLFVEMQNCLADDKSSTTECGSAPSASLTEQQKMLEELNRQIEEQKRQLAEQEEALRLQRAAVGVSMARFSVSDALMSPPPCFGRNPDEVQNTLDTLSINLSKDPRQQRNLSQNAVGQPSTSVHTDDDLNENKDRIKKYQALSQTTFLTHSGKSLVQESSLKDQEANTLTIIKKDPDMTAQDVDKASVKAVTTELHLVIKSESSTHPSASEHTHSSSGNEKKRRSRSPSEASGRTSRSQRHTSRQESHNSPKDRLGHDHRSYHDRRASDDRYHRRSRHSPARSSRRSRSRSRSRRKDQASSRQKDEHHHRHSSRDRHHSAKSCSTRSRSSAKPENERSDQREKSDSRQSSESAKQNTEQTKSLKEDASVHPEMQGDKPQSTTTEDGRQKVQRGDNTKHGTDQSCNREVPPNDPLNGTDESSQRQQEQLNPAQVTQDQTSDVVTLQRDDPSQGALDSFRPENKSQSKSYFVPPGNEFSSTSIQNETDLRPLVNQPPDLRQLQRGHLSVHESDYKSQPLQKKCKIPTDCFSNTEKSHFNDHRRGFSQRPPGFDEGHFGTPEDESLYVRDNPPNMPTQNQEMHEFHHKDSPPQVGPPMARLHISHMDNTLARNYQPNDQLRPRAPAPGFQWRGPHHGKDSSKGLMPLQPCMLRAPHPERFESREAHHPGPWVPRERRYEESGLSPDFGRRDPGLRVPRESIYDESGPSPDFVHNDTGTRVPMERLYDASGPSPVFGQMDTGPRVPRQRLSDDSVPFSDCGQRDAGPRVPRQSIFDDSGHFPDFGPRHPHSASGLLEGPETQTFEPKNSNSDTMFEGSLLQCSGPKVHLPSFRSRDNRGMYKGQLTGPPQRQFDQRDTLLLDLNNPRQSNTPYQVDREAISEFSQEQYNPPQYSDQSRSQTFSRNLPPHHMRRQSPVHPQNPRCVTPPHNQPKGSQFLEMESVMGGSHHSEDDGFGDQEIRKELGGPRIEMSNIYKDGRVPERNAPMRGSRFNPPQNFRGLRPTGPGFYGKRVPAPQNKELFEDKPCSRQISSRMASSSQQTQRPPAPAGGQSLIPSLIQFDGSPRQPGIRPLRLSGPLLPTPPGGPIRLHQHRMAKPCPYNKPQGPSARGHMNEGAKPDSFNVNCNKQKGQTSQSFAEEREEEEYGGDEEVQSSQESDDPRNRQRKSRRGSKGLKRQNRGRTKRKRRGMSREMT